MLTRILNLRALTLPFHIAASSNSYIPEINGLKGLAVLTVLLFHAGIYNKFTPFISPDFPGHLYPLSRGVQLFFIVSGYSLARRYELGIPLAELHHFYLRRIARTWPLWWTICIALYVIGEIDLKRFLINISFTYGFLSDRDTVAAVPVAWSLFIEELFYLLFPALVFWGRRLSGAIALLALAVLFHLEYADSLNLNGANMSQSQWQHVFYHFFTLILGIVVFQLQRILNFVKAGKNIFPYLLDFLALVGLINLYLPNGELKGSFCLAAIVIAAVWKTTLTARIFRIKLLQIFGFYCYGIYLLHSFIDIHLTIRFGEPLLRALENAWLEMAFVFIAGCAITLPAAILCYLIVENRPNQLVKKLRIP